MIDELDFKLIVFNKSKINFKQIFLDKNSEIGPNSFDWSISTSTKTDFQWSLRRKVNNLHLNGQHIYSVWNISIGDSKTGFIDFFGDWGVMKRWKKAINLFLQ